MWLNPKVQNWNEHAEHCHAEDAKLVIIDSEAKNDAVHAFVTGLRDNQPGRLYMYS